MSDEENTKTRILSRQGEKTNILSMSETESFNNEREERLKVLLQAREDFGMSLDVLYDLTSDMDMTSLRKTLGRLSTSPK